MQLRISFILFFFFLLHRAINFIERNLIPKMSNAFQYNDIYIKAGYMVSK